MLDSCLDDDRKQPLTGVPFVFHNPSFPVFEEQNLRICQRQGDLLATLETTSHSPTI